MNKTFSKNSPNSSSLFPSDFLKQVKLLEINMRKLVNSLFTGEYQAAFKGQGMTFAEFREYVPGDDVRHISWSLTAKTGRPYIKKYDEERELIIMLVIDISGSSDYGTGFYLKKDMITQLAALIALTAIKNKDRVGLLLFSEQVEHFIPPKKGRGHVYQILRDILYFQPKQKGTQLEEALEHLMNVLKKKSALFIFSDFLDQNFEKSLCRIGQKHDVVALQITDQTEFELPKIGIVNIQDPETGEVLTVDTSDPLVRRIYRQKIMKFYETRKKSLKKAKVDVIEIMSDKDFVKPLIAYFKRRYKKR